MVLVTARVPCSALDRACSATGNTWTLKNGEKRHYPAYRCSRKSARQERRGACNAPQVLCAKIEPVAWSAIWRHITQAQILLAGAKAYYAAREQNTSATAALEKEAQALGKSIEGMQYMVERGAADPVKTTEKILAKQKRLREVQAELKEAGKVVFIPSERQAEAATRRIADPKNEPVKFEHRRSILESIQDLRMEYFDGNLTIEGAIPMPAAAAVGGSSEEPLNPNKCMVGVHAPYSCLTPIPFRITERIA